MMNMLNDNFKTLDEIRYENNELHKNYDRLNHRLIKMQRTIFKYQDEMKEYKSRIKYLIKILKENNIDF